MEFLPKQRCLKPEYHSTWRRQRGQKNKTKSWKAMENIRCGHLLSQCPCTGLYSSILRTACTWYSNSVLLEVRCCTKPFPFRLTHKPPQLYRVFILQPTTFILYMSTRLVKKQIVRQLYAFCWLHGEQKTANGDKVKKQVLVLTNNWIKVTQCGTEYSSTYS